MKTRFLILPLLLLFACTSDDDQPEENPNTPAPTESLVLVGNEGGFQAGNASLTAIDMLEGTASQNVFFHANNEEYLGDVLQSIYHRDSVYFLVVNNSQKIEMVNDESYARIQTIEGMSSPRFMLFLEEEKAYVSDLADAFLHIIDPATGTYTGSIDLPGNAEHMLEVNGEVWCSDENGDQLYFVDPATDSYTGELTLSLGPGAMVADASGDIWVFAQGTWDSAQEAVLYRVDAETKTTTLSIAFSGWNGYGGSIAISPDGQTIYCLINNNVYTVDVTDPEMPESPFIAGGNRTLYGLFVHPQDGTIGLTDAVDYSSVGAVYFYDADGNETQTFETGVIPNFIYWGE